MIRSTRAKHGCLGALSLLMLGMAGVSRADERVALDAARAGSLHYFNPRLDLRSAPRIGPAIAHIEAYLDRVDDALSPPWRGVIRHTISGAYGSGFLRLNAVSNDLDYFANVHLGEVDIDPAAPQLAAAEILRRIQLFREEAHYLAEESSSAALALGRFMDALPATPLQDHHETRQAVAASLSRVLAGQAYIVGNTYRGVSQVSPMDAGEGYLPLVTNAQFFSNLVDHSGEVFWGVRGVSLQFFFSVDLARSDRTDPPQYVPLSPLAPPRQVSKLWQQAFHGVFARSEGARLFQDTILASAAFPARRLQYAQGFLAALAFEQTTRRYPIKFVKRLHNLLDTLFVLLPPERRQALEAMVERELNGEAAIYADQVKTFGETLRHLAQHPRAFRLYLDSGDIDRMLVFLRQATRRLRRHSDCEVRVVATEVARHLRTMTRTPGWRRCGCDLAPFSTAAAALAEGGNTLVQRLGLPDREMQRLSSELDRFFRDLGFAPVRLYPEPDGTVSLDPRDAACGQAPSGQLEALRRSWTGLGGAAIALGRPGGGRNRPAPYLYHLRCASDPAANARFRTALERLEEQAPLLTPTPVVAHR